MANEAISQRPVASTLKDDDLLLVSQKQTSGGYLTCKVTADKLKGANGLNGQPGKSAYEEWVSLNTSINAFLATNKLADLDIDNISNLVQTQFNTSFANWLINNQYIYVESYLTEGDINEVIQYYKNNFAGEDLLNEVQKIYSSNTTLSIFMAYITNKYGSPNLYTDSFEILFWLDYKNYLSDYKLYESTRQQGKATLDAYMSENPTYIDQLIIDTGDMNSPFFSWYAENMLSALNFEQFYQAWSETQADSTIQNFATVFELNSYNTWVQQTVQTYSGFVDFFVADVRAAVIMQDWLKERSNKTPQDFIDEFNLEQKFSDWLQPRIDKLTLEVYTESLKGKNGKSPSLGSFEQFWISICARYVPDPLDSQSTPSPNDLLIQKIILPTEIFFEQQQIHRVDSDPSDAPLIMMTSSLGFETRLDGHYNELGNISNEPITFTANANNELMIEMPALSRLHVPLGSVLSFSWVQQPSEESVKTVTLSVKKKREYSSDTAVVKLSGYFKFTDSNFGKVTGSDGIPLLLNTSQLPFFSDEFYFEERTITKDFYTVYSISSSGGDPIFHTNATVTIVNQSNVERTLTITPAVSVVAGSIGGRVENQQNLPSNAYMSNGNLIIRLAANQG